MKTFFNFLLSIAVSLFGGFILTKMWGWFIAPKFGLPQIGIVEAVGISTVVNFVLIGVHLSNAYAEARKKHDDIDNDTYNLIKTIVTGAIVYPFCLLGAYIWHLFL